MRRYRWRYLAGVAVLLAIDVLQLLLPRVLGSVADAYAAGALTAAFVRHAALTLAGLAVFISLGRWGWRYFLLGASRQLEAELRRRVFAHLQRMSAGYFIRRRVGDLMAHLTNDVQAVRMAAGQGVVLSVDAVFMTTATVAMMVGSADLRLAALAAAPLVLLSAALARMGREVHRRFRNVQEGFSRLTEFAEENVTGIRVIQSMAREEQEQARFERLADEQVERHLHLARVWAAMGPMTEVAVGVSFAVVLSFGGWLVLNGSVSLGGFVAFTNYLGMLVWPLTSMGWLINMLQRGRASLDRLWAILTEEPEVRDAPGAARGHRLGGSITVENLTFRYPGTDRVVLRDIWFTIQPGQRVGILGRTGSGKTTLAMLLLRLYDPPPGTIFYDGIDVRALATEDLRRQIGYVPQEDFLFSMSIAENIAFGLDGDGRFVDDARVLQAARISHIHEDVEHFADGYASLVGERGLALSGGQKQRTAIARALAKDPAVVIMDDALSSVDAQTEQRILSDLGEALAGRTAIVIAHRVSVLRQCDVILVMEDGAIVERGTHEQLLANGGLYARICERQRLEAELSVS